jgi:hypothetical protein
VQLDEQGQTAKGTESRVKLQNDVAFSNDGSSSSRNRHSRTTDKMASQQLCRVRDDVEIQTSEK